MNYFKLVAAITVLALTVPCVARMQVIMLK